MGQSLFRLDEEKNMIYLGHVATTRVTSEAFEAIGLTQERGMSEQ